jgi:hypothetical protein
MAAPQKGGDYITTSSTVHQQLLDYLQKSKNTLWITTFQQAMDYAIKKRSPAPGI